MKEYSAEIAQAIREHLQERDMKLVAFDEDDGCFGFVMHLPGQISFIHYIIQVHEDDYTVVALCPISAGKKDPTVLANLAEFVCRANYGLKNGNFELDFRDGELRYKCFVDCDDQVPSQSIVRDSIGVPAAMMKRYCAGILNVIFKGMDPEEAVTECENDNHLLRELEEAKRALEHMLLQRRCGTDRQSDDDVVTVEDDHDDDDFPSFEDFLRMDAEEDTSAEDEDADSFPSFEELLHMAIEEDDTGAQDDDDSDISVA